MTTLLLAFVSLSLTTFAQRAADIPSLTFKSAEDYQKYESEVLKSANFILQTPVTEAALKRSKHTVFIMKWMEGTPDYTFNLGEDFMRLTKGNDELPSVYLSAMVKAALDNKVDDEAIDPIAKKLFLDYCANESNNVKYNRKVKKMIKARQKKD